MQHNVQRHGWVSEVNGSEDLFRVIHIDVPENRKAEDAHGFLTVHEENHSRVALPFEFGDETLARSLEKALFENGLHRRKQEEHPKDVARRHCVVPSGRIQVVLKPPTTEFCQASPPEEARRVLPPLEPARHAAETPCRPSGPAVFLPADFQAAASQEVAPDVRTWAALVR